PKLTLLELAPDSIADEDYEGVFSGSRIETIASDVYPEGMLTEMPRLTTVIWNNADERMPDGRLTDAGNPNILFWALDKDLAPADAVNTVVFTDDDDAYGEAESIVLQAGYPFNAHRPFNVATAEVIKEFTLPTEIGHSSGWETITLPFTADSIMHETAGRITPYAVWTGPEHPMKPFWLYGADAETETGWAADSIMRAGVPYIISMPNNDEYVHAYNLPGKVRFVATDVTLGVAESLPKTVDWIEGAKFVGTFMPVEEEGIRSINVNELAGEEYLGSAFVPEDETLPFGAYITGEGLPSRIPVFGEWSGVLTVLEDGVGIVVETPAPGMIRVSGSRDCQVAIVTPEGAVIRTLSLKAGESVTEEGLTRGLYIVAGRKVMVR
ncbi:MAG: hypothetical protein K2J58_02340, partial [Muribaculaceae bacterium]|nr:hypothetical protein [Muribaculaceae bacterium]